MVRDDDMRGVRTAVPRGDAAFDDMLRASLGAPEEPPDRVRAALLTAVQIRAQGRDRGREAGASATGAPAASPEPASPVPWWAISLAGVLQSASATLFVGMLHPGPLVLCAVGATGVLLSACAVALPLVARGRSRVRFGRRSKGVCA